MNDFFDPTNPGNDAEITSMLATLPEPPSHGANFWADLDRELDGATPAGTHRSDRTTRLNGRAQFLLVAAALLAIAGAIGVAANASRTDTVDIANTPPPTLVPTPTTVIDDVDPVPSEAPIDDANRYVSEIFRYDVAIPADMRLEMADERGIYSVNEEGPVNATLSMSNYFPADDLTLNATGAYDGEVLVEQTIMDVPLYSEVDGEVTMTATRPAEQFVFDRGEFGERITRVFAFEDRTIVVELVINDAELLAQDANAILDGIRLYEGPIAPIATCSSDGLPVLQAPAELTEAAAARFDGIIEALVSCDWELLEAQMDEAFMVSFAGEVDAIALWQQEERYGQSILRALYDHLAFPVGGDDEGAIWPRGWNSAEAFDAETQAALLASEYYDESDLDIWEEITYLGFRTGISDEGFWSYFIAGD